jgi:hypothetical protein
MMQIQSKLIDNEIIDLNIYKTGGLRLLWNSKFGKNSNLEFYKGVNYQYENEKQLFMDCLLKNISEKHHFVNFEITKDVKIVRKGIPRKQTSLIIKDIIKKYINQPIELLKKYLDLLDVKRADRYVKWLEVGMCLHNCNPTEKCFKLWDEWSKFSENYHSKDFNAYKWNSFKFNNYSIGTLKYLAKQDSPENYEQIVYSLEEPLYQSFKFNENYIMDEKDKIKDLKNITAIMINKWMLDSSIKSLAINSCYDTGKTSTIKKILDEYSPKKVLFVSYRQTLTHELHGGFIDKNVTNYLDPYYNSNRLICQIESLHKLIDDYNFIGEDSLIPVYDLIILDEIESILAHFRSSTILEKEKTFNLFADLVYNANKVLALDGDFHNRGYEFLKHFEENLIVLKNECKKNQKHFIFTNDRFGFEARIDDDLKKGLNIVLTCMSSKIATFFYNKYKDSFKCVLHCAKADDKLKKELKNVNNFWINYELVIYSPQHFVFLLRKAMQALPKKIRFRSNI